MKWKTMKLSEQEITVNIALHVCKIYVKEWGEKEPSLCVNPYQDINLRQIACTRQNDVKNFFV